MKSKNKLLYILSSAVLVFIMILAVKAPAKAASVGISEINFPDSVFRAWVSENCDSNKDGTLDTSELKAVKTINVGSKGISRLDGIEYFTDLKELYAYSNQLKKLDLSGNTSLQSLNVSENALETLYISDCLELKTAIIYGNRLTGLDVSDNLMLEGLLCGDNLLTSLNLSDLPVLTILSVQNNKKLTFLDCSNCSVAALDVNGCTALTTLNCRNNDVTLLDISTLSSLKTLDCRINGLKKLNLSGNPVLRSLDCRENSLASLDLHSNPKLERLDVSSNELTSLDVSSNPELKSLHCTENELTSLDTSGNPALTVLNCCNNQLTSLDTNSNPELKSLYCYGNALTSLNVRNCTGLTSLNCRENELTSLNVSGLTELEELFCHRNELKNLYISGCTALSTLYCHQNQLTTLNIGTCPNIIDVFKYGVRAESGNEIKYFEYSKDSLTFCVDKDVSMSMDASPVFTTQPVKVTAAVGETAKFTAEAAGTGLTYQWQYRNPSGTNVWKNSGATGNKTRTLTITVKEASNKMQYRCKVTDANGQKKNSNYASLIVKTTILTHPVKVTAAVGETAKYTVAATGAGLKYQWQYRNPSGTNVWKNSGAPGNKTTALSIAVKESSNKMQYRCVITDANGKTVNTHYASLLVKTTITTQPKNTTATAGKSYSISVKATGAGLKYAWYYKSASASSFTKSSITTATYTNTAKASSNGMQFYCIITDANGKTVKTSTVTLTVK